MNPKARHKARRLLLQAIYQWQLSEYPLEAIKAQFHQDKFFNQIDQHYFNDLLAKIVQHHNELDLKLKPFLDRNFEELDPIELAVLRIGAYELLHRPEIPYRVTINEAIELTKLFGAQDSHKYVNGILDKLAQQTRQDEIQSS